MSREEIARQLEKWTAALFAAETDAQWDRANRALSILETL